MAEGDMDNREAQDDGGLQPLQVPAQDHDHGHDHGHDRCDEALKELYTFLDGELTDQRRIQIAHHLDDCSPCLEVYDFEAELRMVIARKCRDSVPESLRIRIHEVLVQESQQQFPGSSGGPGLPGIPSL